MFQKLQAVGYRINKVEGNVKSQLLIDQIKQTILFSTGLTALIYEKYMHLQQTYAPVHL